VAWLTLRVTRVRLRKASVSFGLIPGTGWLEGSVGIRPNLHVPADPGNPHFEEALGMEAVIGVDPHKHVLSAVALD
jgi:hypothetical protein